MDFIISALIGMLDTQLQNCIQSGARFAAVGRIARLTGGSKTQNAYYDGHCNAAEVAVWSIDPGANIVCDWNGKHRVEWSDRKRAAC